MKPLHNESVVTLRILNYGDSLGFALKITYTEKLNSSCSKLQKRDARSLNTNKLQNSVQVLRFYTVQETYTFFQSGGSFKAASLKKHRLNETVIGVYSSRIEHKEDQRP